MATCETDLLILEEHGIEHDGIQEVSLDQISEEESRDIQSRSSKVLSHVLEALEMVESDDLPAGIGYIADGGNLVVISGFHRFLSRKSRGDTWMKLIVIH